MKRIFFILILILTALSVSAQSLPDFSGVWIQDKEKSDDFYKTFNVQCSITQTKQSFTVKMTFSDENGQELVTREGIFSLDGTETVSDEGAKLSAKWSADNTILTTSDVKDYGGDLVGVTISYSITDNKNILTVKSSDIKPFTRTIIQVFNRKQ